MKYDNFTKEDFILEIEKIKNVNCEFKEYCKSAFEDSAVATARLSGNGKIIKCNTKFAQLFGYTSESILNAHIDKISRSDDSILQTPEVKKVWLGELDQFTTEKSFIRKDNSMLWCNITISTAKSDMGKPKYFLMVVHDISTEKKLVDDLLKEKEFTSRLINSMPGVFYLCSIDNFDVRLLKWNKNYETVTGYSPKELKGKNIFDFFDKKDYPRFNKALETLGNTGSVKIELRTVMKNGKKIPYYFEGYLFSDSGRQFYLGVGIDISERVKIQEILSKREQQFSLAMKGANDGLWDWNVADHSVYFSPRWKEILGYKEDEIENEFDSWVKLLHPDDSESAKQTVNDFLIGNEDNYESEFRMKHKDGTSRHILARGIGLRSKSGDIIRIVGTHLDITELKKIESKLIENEEKFKKVFINNPNPLYLTSLPEGRFLDVNPMFEKVSGYNCDEIIGKTVGELNFYINEDDRTQLLDELKNKGRLHNYELSFKVKNGNIIDCLINSELIDIQGTSCLVNIVTDITALKRIEKQRQENAKQIKALLNATSDKAMLIDKTGKIIAINSAMAKSFNKSTEELKNTIAFNLLQPDLAKERNKKFIEAEKSRATVRFIDQRDELWFDNRIYPIFDQKGKISQFAVYSRDITKQRNDEKVIQEKEELIRSIIENSQDWIWAINKNGVHTYSNFGVENILGYSVNELLGKTNFELMHEDDRKVVGEMLPQLIAKKEGWKELVVRWKHKNGSWKFLESNATPIFDKDGEISGFRGVDRDISVRKKAEIELQERHIELKQLSNELTKKNRLLLESKNKFKNLFEKSPVSIWEQDFSETLELLHKKKAETKNLEKYLDNNPDFVKKCISKINILNVNNITLDLIGVKNLDELVSHIRKSNNKISVNILKNELLSIVSGEKDFYGETEFIKKDGTILHAIIKSTMLDDNGKNIASIIDITTLKKTEEELIIAKEKAEESDLLKTEFINNMSHEIRTPLNGILGFSDMLNMSNLTDDKRANFVKIIQSSGHQLLRIIDDILEISRLGTKQVKVVKSEVCINDVLLELFSMFEEKAKENKIRLYLKKPLSDKKSTIFTDKTKLIKVLGNLLENALKFTMEGSIEFGYQLKSNDLELYVKDTGIGIESVKHKTIFERFSQAEKELSKNVGGIGLGLSIAKENIELLGGTTRLESKKGEGSIFFVTIPYKPVFKGGTIDMDTSKNKYTILIAEDEEMNFLYLETLLKDVIGLECKVIHAINGKEAIEICKKSNAIDLVLMDLKMPVMNGHEAAKQIKEIYPNLPIIAQTAYSTSADKEKAALAGCDDFMAKPISHNTLSEILKEYLITDINN